MIQKISVQDALLKRDAVFLDTRTPKEFAEDHLPEAINIPIFSNEERALVGTIYRQISPKKAIEAGIKFFSGKLPEFTKAVSRYKKKEIIAYCWRGGMRSKTVVSLFSSLGYNICQLEGGHKQYRAYVKERLQKYVLKPRIIVLRGLTCAGKTALLKLFANSLDLEGMAQHRGSLYGGIGLVPNSQKQFESQLLQRLDKLNNKPYIIIEGESRQIGNVQIPEFLHEAMIKGIQICITRNIQKRAEEAAKEYFTSAEDIRKIMEITSSLQKVISAENKLKTMQLIGEKKYPEAAMILLKFYYDPLYGHSLNKFNYAFEINNDDPKQAASELKERIDALIA